MMLVSTGVIKGQTLELAEVVNLSCHLYQWTTVVIYTGKPLLVMIGLLIKS